MVDRWELAGAPRRLLDSVRGAFQAFVERLPAFGLSIETYLLEARDAFDLPEVRAMYDDLRAASGGAPLQSSTRERKATALPNWSTLVSTWKLLLQKWGREGWCVMWARISEIAKVLGVKRRQAWERMYWLEELGLIRVWRRWRGPEHDVDDDEPRSNIIGLFLPDGLLEALRERLARRAARRAARARVPDVAAAEPAPSSRAVPSVRPGPRSQRAPSSEQAPRSAGWLTWVFHHVRAQDPRYRGEDARRAGSMRPEPERELQKLFLAEAKAARDTLRAWRKEHPTTATDAPQVPLDEELPELARRLAADAMTAWLAEGDRYITDAMHGFGLFYKPAARLAAQARGAFVSGWIDRANEADERALEASRPRPRIVQRVPLEVSREISVAHRPPAPAAPARPPLGLAPERLAIFAAMAEEEELASTAPAERDELEAPAVPELQVEHRAIDQDFDTLVSPSHPPG